MKCGKFWKVPGFVIWKFVTCKATYRLRFKNLFMKCGKSWKDPGFVIWKFVTYRATFHYLSIAKQGLQSWSCSRALGSWNSSHGCTLENWNWFYIVTGFKGRFTRVPSHVRSICAISNVETMEVETYHFTQGSQVLSPMYDVDAYMVTLFWRWGLRIVLRVGSSK